MELHVIEDMGMVIPVDDDMQIVKPVYGYLKFQHQKGRTLNTLKANGNDLRTYWHFLSEYGYNYCRVSPNTIIEFIDFLRGPSDNVISLYRESARTGKTINRILSTVHQFYKYCRMTGHISDPIIMENISGSNNMFQSFLHHARKDNQVKRSVFKIRESARPVKLLTDKEVGTIYNALSRQRDKLLFKALYLTGARIQEILDLKIESVPIPDSSVLTGVFRQIKSKGKYRNLYVPMSLIEEFDAFILSKRSRIITSHNYIFVSEQPQNLGKQLTYRGVYEVFRRIQSQASVCFHFHDLRHTFISSLVESGMDISIVRILAGHEQISTTQKYTHLSDKFIMESLEAYWKRSFGNGGETNA